MAAHIVGQAANVRIAGTAVAMAGTVVKAKYVAIPTPAPAEENIAIFLLVILPVLQDMQLIFDQIYDGTRTNLNIELYICKIQFLFLPVPFERST